MSAAVSLAPVAAKTLTLAEQKAAAGFFETAHADVLLSDVCAHCDGAGCVECSQTGVALTEYAIDDADLLVHAFRSERAMEHEGVAICGMQSDGCAPYIGTTEQKTHADCIACSRRIQRAMATGKVRS